MRHRVAFVLTLLVVFVAVPAVQADVKCEVYWDKVAYDNDDAYSFCWLSSRVCHQCYDEGTAEHCASDWEPCDPYPKPPPQPIVAESLFGAEPEVPRCVATQRAQTIRVNADDLL